MVGPDGRPPEQAAPLPLQGSPQGGAQPPGRCSLTGLERAGGGVSHRGPRDSGRSLAPPGRVQSSLSFLCSPDPAMTETTENMQEGSRGGGRGLSPKLPGEGRRSPRPEGNTEWVVPALPRALVPQTACPLASGPPLSGTWSICICSLAAGLGAAAWAL